MQEIMSLSVPERIQLVEDIWDTIALSAQLLPISESMQSELDRRLAKHEANPSEGVDWDILKRRLTDSR